MEPFFYVRRPTVCCFFSEKNEVAKKIFPSLRHFLVITHFFHGEHHKEISFACSSHVTCVAEVIPPKIAGQNDKENPYLEINTQKQFKKITNSSFCEREVSAQSTREIVLRSIIFETFFPQHFSNSSHHHC